jgi:hypothetical protein
LVVRLGADTIMLEQFTSSHGVVEGDVVDRSPTTSIFHYLFSTDSAENIVHFDATQRAAASPTQRAPIFQVTADRVHDGFDVVVREADSTHRRFIAAPAGAILVLARSVGLYELLTTRLRQSGGDSLRVPVLDLDSSRFAEQTLRRLGADSVVIPLNFPRGEHARVDATGRILGVSGMATSYKWLTERVPDFDIAGVTRSFAARDTRGDSLGTYSSRDTVRAVIDGAHIAIDYGRPRKRGRVIFGGLVPWGQVWRTGADLATHLTTDRDLRFGDLALPAGTYTLYTVPSSTEWTLVVNRHTGQSGLFYDPSGDLGRVAMTTNGLSSAVERLTIGIDQIGAANGRLTIAWDRVMAAVPFIVVPPSPAAVRPFEDG